MRKGPLAATTRETQTTKVGFLLIEVSDGKTRAELPELEEVDDKDKEKAAEEPKKE